MIFSSLIHLTLFVSSLFHAFTPSDSQATPPRGPPTAAALWWYSTTMVPGRPGIFTLPYLCINPTAKITADLGALNA